MTNWTREDVWLRFLEAAEAIRRANGVRGPQAYGSAWPEILRDFADKTASEETRDPRKFEESFYRKLPAPADAISRADELLDWTNLFLDAEPGKRRCIWALALCRAHGRSFIKLCKARGWSRSTAMRRAGQALDDITTSLNEMVIPTRHARREVIESLTDWPAPSSKW